MSPRERDVVEAIATRTDEEGSGTDLPRLLSAPPAPKTSLATPGLALVTGKLVATGNGGRTPLVLYQGQPGTTALAARAIVDLRATHVGHEVVLMFEEGDPARPVIMGVLRESLPVPDHAGQVEIDADGESLVVSGKQQVVIRCGEASITLTKAGKVVIQGEYVISRARRTNRIEGGGVQIN